MATDQLRRWLVEEVTSARGRLAGGVLGHLPVEEMAVHADGGGIPAGYVLWHLARHHDLAVNAVLRGRDQVIVDHLDALGVSDRLHRGLSESADVELVEILDLEAVAAYALASLDSTVAWLTNGAPIDDLDEVPDSVEILGSAGVPPEEFAWLYQMWEGKPRRWFLSWSAIGHVVTHTGELVSIRNRLGHSPF